MINPDERAVILPDGFALSGLDTVYPPMRWSLVWSTGSNLPLGLRWPQAWQQGLHIPDYYEIGMWLFSEQKHGRVLAAIDQSHAGRTVRAYTSDHAIYLLRKEIGYDP